MSVHVHGQFSRAPFDGWAGDYALPGQYKDYYYPNAQSARTIWYHDHTEHHTAENAYNGQEGGYIISDPEEQALNLPKGKHDIPITITSKSYNWDGSLKWATFGDVLQVNGQPWPYLNVEPRKYRFRLLNACISRALSLSLREGLDGEELEYQVIASDSGLFSHPITTCKLAFSQGERYELVVDFAKYAGKNVTMRNDRNVVSTVDYPATDRVLRFVVDKWINDDTNNGDLPQHLRNVPSIPKNATVEKEFSFTRRNDRGWLINGVGFSDIRNRILTRPVRGSEEIWTFTNGALSGSHPVHIHLVEFQVISRTGGRNYVEPYEAAGLKDVVWLAPGETVKVLARYAPWPGIYMFHCHNLIHEDHDMLVAFNVTQLGEWGYTDDTLFIDPMELEFRPKYYNPHEDGTDIAIREKIAWFYSKDPYNKGNVVGVYEALNSMAAWAASPTNPPRIEQQPSSSSSACTTTSTIIEATWLPTQTQTPTSGDAAASTIGKPNPALEHAPANGSVGDYGNYGGGANWWVHRPTNKKPNDEPEHTPTPVRGGNYGKYGGGEPHGPRMGPRT
ncbi:Cupredoxin [Periconia macrospinosa]|uniref:Cupredoxin n=1 Tax=Periconia macrospinosa TaxID=97972 RepID=A0A2V1CXY0_9PLEO|nr:Cupredoxin [Periconia macrospinosa]